MRIGILGTRGIPNEYGGFEQFAMHFAEYLVKEGMEVVVYNSSNHPYKKEQWRGVEIVSCFDPEPKIGSAGQFIYDLNSILNARKQKLDILFQMGYTSSSIWGFLFPKHTKVITNMDGQEWKRSKYSSLVQKFLKRAEKWAVRQSDELISDSRGIQDYLLNTYQVKSHFIAYGANEIQDFDPSVLEKYELNKSCYNLLIARLEPENNVETVIKGHSLGKFKRLVIIGSLETKHGQYLKQKYGKEVTFLGSNYNFSELNSLRHFSNYYFHGHSVGGTNPSLLEAMACGCSIIAHSNPFNRDVLENNAFYFDSPEDIKTILTKDNSFPDSSILNNLKKIRTIYSFSSIHNSLKKLIVDE